MSCFDKKMAMSFLKKGGHHGTKGDYQYEPERAKKSGYTDPQTGAVTAETFTTTNSYNILNQLINSEDNMGYIRQWEQDEVGNNTRYTDAEGNVTDRILDELNREIETKQYLKDETGVVIDTISVLKEYDENSNLTALTDDKGNRTAWTYDELNRTLQEIMPDGTVYKDYTGGYDVNSNLATLRDANGNVIIKVFVQVGEDCDWQTIDAGGMHTIALKNNGTLWGSGWDETGHLNISDNSSKIFFTPIK